MRLGNNGQDFTEELDESLHCEEPLEGEEMPQADLSWGWSQPGDAWKAWPKGEDGEPVAPAFLTHCSSQSMEDEMLINMLGAYGITSVKQFPSDGTLGRIVLGMSGTGVDIYVPATMLDEAKELIKGD